jgi:hypothetical protein
MALEAYSVHMIARSRGTVVSGSASLRLALCSLSLATSSAFAEEPHAPIMIPIRIVNGFPILEAHIGEHGLPLMFDLGGEGGLSLMDETLQQAGIQTVAETDAWKDAKGNLIESPKFRVDEIVMGSEHFRDVEGHVVRFADSFRPQAPDYVGMIGAEFVRPYRVLLDYAGGSMTLLRGDEDEASAAGCRGTIVPFLPEWEGSPVTRATTDLGELTFVWDTGARTSILQGNLLSTRAAELTDLVFTSDSFRLGGEDFGPLGLRSFDFAEPAGVDGFVGANFFANHVVCVDFPNARLRVR